MAAEFTGRPHCRHVRSCMARLQRLAHPQQRLHEGDPLGVYTEHENHVDLAPKLQERENFYDLQKPHGAHRG